MLPLENFENPTFQEIVEKAKINIQKIYPAWTNYNPADSGMALVELFAFMTEAQQFYLAQTGYSHQIAFLHLLGMSPQGIQAASVFAKVEGVKKAFPLLRGTRAFADQLLFESEQTVYMEIDDLLVREQDSPFYPFGENPVNGAIYDMFLRHPLERDVIHTLYFELYEAYPVLRNPVQPEEWIPLVRLQLEYYDGVQYRACEIIEDTTFGLLQTGSIQFRFSERMEHMEVAYPLRLVMEGEYDTAPLVKAIHFNMVSFIQKDTRIECQSFALQKEEKEFYEIVVDSWLAVNGNTKAYVKMKEGFCQITEFSSYMHEGRRHFLFVGEIFERVDNIVICLVSQPRELSWKEYTYYGTGMPNQQFFLPDHNVLGSSFAIWVEKAENPGYYTPWSAVSDFASVGKEAQCYVLEEENGILRFGNGRQGVIPKGRIEIICYAVCGGRAGNILKKQIGGFMEPVGAEHISNPYSAVGGKERESIEDCFKRYKEYSGVKSRAVTRKDYEEVIKETPGLRIKKVKVFDSKIKENCLEVVVQPYTNGDRIITGEAYERNIIRCLENKKMLGTQVAIRKPEYIGISLQLEIMVKNRYLDEKARIEGHIRKYFEREMDFGKTIVYSRLFGYIDGLPESMGIYNLTLHVRGKGVSREENMDIKLPFHGMAYLKEMAIRCVLAEE